MKFIAIGNRRWIEQSLVRRRTDSSRGELDVKTMSAKPSSSSIARRSSESFREQAGRSTNLRFERKSQNVGAWLLI